MIFTDRSKAVLLWIIYVSSVLFCYAFMQVSLLMPCGHLLGKGWPLGFRLWCLIVTLSLSHLYLGSGVVLDCIDSWYLPSFLLFCALFICTFSLKCNHTCMRQLQVAGSKSKSNHSLIFLSVQVWGINEMRRRMGFPTMWYVRPAKPQISLRIRAVWSEPLLVACIFFEGLATDWTAFGDSKLKRMLHGLVWVYTCQNVKLLEISCRGSNYMDTNILHIYSNRTV